MDRLPAAARSKLMSCVRRRDTRPEIVVRRLLHGLGLRFRLQRADLPGRPDIVLVRRRTAIFVHGCFWHRHRGCRRTTTPATRREFWLEKFRANRSRDGRNQRALEALGWRVVVVWECETLAIEQLEARLKELLCQEG